MELCTRKVHSCHTQGFPGRMHLDDALEEDPLKKTVHGIRYNTDSAIVIGTAGMLGVLTHWEATLYGAPRSNRYFIVGFGGPMTRFSQSVGCNAWKEGADLIPLTPEQAKQWAELYLAPEVVQQHFAT